ncbi:MAG: BON domain-containing protein [Legionella sp.]|nr:BON domain-containing protein [Legionella sp.]
MRQCANFITTAILVFFLTQLQAADLKKIENNISDSVITTKITAKFTQSTILNPLKISVSTEKGVVKLNGYVKDKEAFVEALRLVKTTDGVQSIRTGDLYIKKVNTAFTDAFITARVETAVLKAKVLDDDSIPIVGINATTNNGIVTLSGNVKNSKSVAFIIKRVNAIHGVQKIITKLEIKNIDAV